MKKILALGLTSALVAPAAFAGSPVAPVVEPVVAAPVVVVPVTPDWTGFTLGAQIGYGDYSADSDLGDSRDMSGMTYGLNAGYNYDFGTWVLGADLYYDWSDVNGDGVDALGGHSDIAFDNVTTLKAKVGYKAGQSLIYGTAGWQWADATIDGESFSGDGWVAGIGVDYLLNPNWVLGAEVLYSEYSDFDNTGIDIEGAALNLKAAYKF